MANKKSIREKGKIRLSHYFKKFKKDDIVSVVQERSLPAYFPDKIIGNTGRIQAARGTHYVVKLNDGNMPKEYILHPLNLRLAK